jgi:hypothetical protein
MYSLLHGQLALLDRHDRRRIHTASMWVAGIMQGLMWREYGADGYLLNSFADVLPAIHPMYVLRGLGGVLYLSGAVFMVINVWKTIAGSPLRAEAPLYNIDQNKATTCHVARACRIRGRSPGCPDNQPVPLARRH